MMEVIYVVAPIFIRAVILTAFVFCGGILGLALYGRPRHYKNEATEYLTSLCISMLIVLLGLAAVFL